MRFQVDITASLALAALFLTGCGHAAGNEVTFSVVQGKQYCEVFRIPAPWVIQPPGSDTRAESFDNNIEYRWPVSSRTEIMVSPPPTRELDSSMAHYTGRMVHLQRYRFTLSIPVRLRQASEDEWTAGSQAELWPGPDEYSSDMLDAKGYAVPEGHREERKLKLAPFLPRSGNIWEYYFPALLSPQSTYLALQSWNGWRGPQGESSNFADLFIDLYRWPSKTLIAKIDGGSAEYTADGVLGQTRWLTNNDLTLNFGARDQGFLLCHIPD
jgi:hypothetical protein